MNNTFVRNIGLAVFALVVLSSCVPTKQYKELEYKHSRAVCDRDSLKNVNEELTVKTTELGAELSLQQSELTSSRQQLASEIDSSRYYKRNSRVNKAMYNELFNKQTTLIKTNQEETGKLLAELQVARQDLQVREDKLYSLQDTLDAERSRLNVLRAQLNERDIMLVALDSTLQNKESHLKQKSKQIDELERVLRAKDSAVMELKNKVMNALLGFKNQGLSVTKKNGKVYVSLDEKLLFKSGKWDVDPKGQKALRKLATVLAANKDVNVMIEGHTDDVEFKGKNQIKDNWDLSVVRATSIVKILLQNKNLDPKRLVASGRSHYFPLDSRKTPEARQKNRRTEIILTPDLSTLYKILE